MKKIFTLIAAIIFSAASAQNTMVFDPDSSSYPVNFMFRNGTLTTSLANPSATGSNTSAMVAMYVRDTTKYDNLHIQSKTKFVDVTPWASSGGTKVTLMVWSNMPVGSPVQLQFGTSMYNTYPAAIHSEYSALTTATRQWEMLTFNYVGMPTGGFTMPGSIDKMILLFRPNSNTRDTIYFDQLRGPMSEPPTALAENQLDEISVGQNKPNPASDVTFINVQLDRSKHVSVKLYDMLGKEVMNVMDKDLASGSHNVQISTSELPSGVYFYTVSSGTEAKTMKMIVSK